jgi:hypothetical protein
VTLSCSDRQYIVFKRHLWPGRGASRLYLSSTLKTQACGSLRLEINCDKNNSFCPCRRWWTVLKAPPRNVLS